METKNKEEAIISNSSKVLLSSYIFGAFGSFDQNKEDSQKSINVPMLFSESGINHAKAMANKAIGYELSEETFNATFHMAIIEIVTAALKFGLFSYYIKEYPNRNNKDLSKYLQDVVDALDFIPSNKTAPSRNGLEN